MILQVPQESLESVDGVDEPEVADDVVSAPQVVGVDPIGSRLEHGLLRFPLGGGVTAAPRW
jgi:hypothetical protein